MKSLPTGREDHQVRQEERDMASQQGSHITAQEQQTR